MSRLNDLLRRLSTSDPSLAADLQREVDALADRRAFGLNFERHVPEAVELPGRRVRKGDKVRVLPERGVSPTAANDRLWRVLSVNRTSESATAVLEALEGGTTQNVPLADLVVVAEFRDPIYPGLVSTGKVERGGDKPFHSVINAENFHALQTLLFTHRGRVDCIYIDPPYNTGAKDWKYNNDYVEGDDLYRHSKWLAFMERRLLLAKELLNPEDSVLVVTIDEKEYLRLGLLLEQIFPNSRIQMITSVINPMGSRRSSEFSRVEEYIFFVMIGSAAVPDSPSTMLNESRQDQVKAVRWTPLNRDGNGWERAARPKLFYPLHVNSASLEIELIGDPIALDIDKSSVTSLEGCQVVWPLKGAIEARWQVGPETARQLLKAGYLTVSSLDPARGTGTVRYLTSGAQKRIEEGVYIVTGQREDGSKIVETTGQSLERPRSMWVQPSHSARDYGSALLSQVVGGRKFPFPKSLYAVEDALRFFVGNKPEAAVLDFFSGSGTTAHAVMRLNRQDGGRRQCISVTNNEVAADEEKELRRRGLRPGDPEWETYGICDYITKPRISAAITGETPQGDPIKGDYKFTDEFPMSEGFEENAEFFTLTYESPLRVSSNREFAKIAPLLWMRAGSRGRRIDDVISGWDVADTYGVIADLNQTEVFLKEIISKEGVVLVYIVTDEDRLFESVVRELPEHVEPVRLYEAYLRNFEIETGRNSL